jgi:hypothetical protein
MSDLARPMPTPAVAKLMRELVDSLRVRLRDPMTALFDTLDDTLFELGEHARSGEAQQQYFTALRECRRKRSAIQESFLEALGTQDPSLSENLHPLHAKLSLVTPEDLEEDIALDSMAARTAQRLSGTLYTLSQRMGYLLGDGGMDGMRNPLGPLHIGKAFRTAATALETGLQTRLVLYKLFERQILGGLEPAYTEMNVRLAAAGVLPTLSPRQDRDRQRTPPPRADQRPPQQVPAVRPPAPATTPASNSDLRAADLMAALRVLLIREPDADAEVPVLSSRRTTPAADVMDRALARLRTRPLSGKPLPPPRLLAAQLLAEARYADDGMPPSPQQAATVDIVGRVFDAIAHDLSVPRPMQPLMQTLLLPVMRASLRQPGMLAENNHPLRQLLDLLGESAIGWCPSVDPDESLLGSMRAALQQIAGSEHGDDANRTITQLRAQLEHQRRRAELAEQRVVEATAGRERLWQARREVHQALSNILSTAPVSAWVRYLVTHPWANCLVLLWLRHGMESQPYREALHFAESLVWCSNAGTDRVEQLRLRALMPVMEIQLRQGLATVAYQDSEIRQLVGELQQFLRHRMGELPVPDFLEQEPPAGKAPGALEADPGNIEDQPVPQQIDPDLLARIRSLRPGTWFEFGAEAHAQRGERARLSWVSPYSGRCLFVNRNGVKVAERRPEEIAHDIECGLVSVLESAQMLERALVQVLAQLRGDVTQAKRA